jgi:sporulation protein YlmC with PRC-barrel domain
MLRIGLRNVSALAVLVAVAGLATAEPPVVKDNAPAQTIRIKSILGAKVNLQGGGGIGTVEDVVLTDEGVVDYLIVSQDGKLVTVPWEAAKFNHEKRTAVINITEDQYKQIPTYTVEKYPDFYAPAYRTQVYKYYGLTPGQERRLERRERRP